MNQKMIPFSPPFIDEEVISEVVNTLRSGWITTGPKVRLLENEVCKLGGISHTLCVNSWSSGALLVLKWFGVGAGDEVIVPAYTYAATALAILQCGATPVMVDINDDLTINPEMIRKAITQKTKVIIPVDIAGLMCDYDAINDIVNEASVTDLFDAQSEKQKQLGRILVLADAAHSIGAMYKNKPSGCATDITIFSFHAVKNITTAEGGAICINLPPVFDNEAEYKLMRMWSLNGQTKDAFTKSQIGGWRYDILFAGLKMNMPDLNAAFGLAQIRKYTTVLLPQRDQIANLYQSFFSQKDWAILPVLKDNNRLGCNHLYALRIKGITEEERDYMIEKIGAMGVSVNVHFIPMPMLTLFRNMGYDIANFPNAYKQYSCEISLPIYPGLTDGQVSYICESVEKSYQSI